MEEEFIEDEFLVQLTQLNENLEALLAIVQDESLAGLLEVAKDLRTLAAKALGYRVK